MEIILSEYAGFCFGVNKAVNAVEKLLKSGTKVTTLGPLIHNPSYIDTFRERGGMIAESIEDTDKSSHLVIRAHGITKQLLDEIKSSGIEFTDATCPFVMKIQNTVNKESTAENIVLIAGDENHPEVKGFRSYCRGASYVFKNEAELSRIFTENEHISDKEIIYVAQTTFSIEEYKKCTDLIKKYCTNVKIFDTICDATSKRQKDACNLSHKCDIIIIYD
jgi:4-hydroxy-3-methylbut-2-enyl diphosphate reductase